MQTDPFEAIRPYWFEGVQTFPGESAPVGAVLEISMDGGATLADTSLACQLSIEALAAGKAMVATFAGPMPSIQHVQLFNGPSLVYAGSSFGQPQLTFQRWPQRVRQEIIGGQPEQELQFDSLSTVTLDGLPIGTGNRIVLDPDGPALVQLTTFTRHRVRVMGIDSVRTTVKLPPRLISSAGSGAFSAPATVAAGSAPQALAIGDLNADGHPDLVVANSGGNNLSVRLGDGGGGFGPRTDWSTAAQPWAVAIGDVTGDGVPDLVAADRADNKISVLPGNGSGGFGARTDYTTASSPSAIALADLNGDGRADVVVACAGASGGVSVFLANASGTLDPRTDYAAGTGAIALAIGEVDGKGGPDIVVANSLSNNISLLPGDGLGGFGPKTDFPAGSAPWSVALSDLDQDGLPDAVVANHSGGTVSVLRGIGPGGFAPPSTVSVGGSPVAVALADVNGDELPDVVVANPSIGKLTLLFGNGSGGVGSQVHLIQAAQPNGVALADVDNDGTPDILDADGAGFASVLLGLGGSVTPAGAHDFAAGASPVYAITPGTGFVIANVRVDGVSQGAISSYPFIGVGRPHTLTAKFALVTGVGESASPGELAVLGVEPNPSARSRLRVRFTLPAASRAQLELLDIAGRRIAAREVGFLGAGAHTVLLAQGARLEPGLYWIRLSQDSARRTAKVVVVE